MPRYDYHCWDCGHTFEIYATITQKAELITPKCPKCHSDATQQVFHPVPFSGFAFHGDPTTIVDPKVDKL